MEERKSMGSALVDVFDAGVTLVKSELSAVARKVGDTAKAKGIGVLLLLAALGPLVMALIFLILAVFYGLMRLGLGAWAAALLIALLSFALTGALVFLGLRKLSAEVDSDEPRVRRRSMTDDDEANSNPKGTAAPRNSTAPGKEAGSTPGSGLSAGEGGVEVGRDAQRYASGESRVVAERPGSATVRVEGGTATVPVYESKPDGQPEMYGPGMNEKLNADDHHKDPHLHGPVALRGAPGIPVSTDPTFQDDMRRGER